MSGVITGPLRRIWFSGEDAARFYDLPASTRDLRYDACADHHPACDCREAMITEAFAERKAEYDELYDAVLEAIDGHQTYATTVDGLPDEFAMCKCPACVIARKVRVGYFECKRQRQEATEFISAQARARYASLYWPDTDEVPF